MLKYLSAVYPTAHFSRADEARLVALLQTRMFFYINVDTHTPPWELLEPEQLGVALSKCPSKSLHTCRWALRGLLNCRLPAGTNWVRAAHARSYHGLVPCQTGADCSHRLAAYAPAWCADLEAQGDDAYLEADEPLHKWQDFLDGTCRYGTCRPLGGQGFWYVLSPGSGIFYHAGRTLAAPSKLLMLVRLLDAWLDPSHTARDDALVPDLHMFSGGAPRHFLGKLRLVAQGMPCGEAGLAHCYDEVEGGQSYTLMDHYDFLLMDLGRALGYKSLLFTASFLRPDVDEEGEVEVLTWTEAEVVDLRLPSGFSRRDWQWQSAEQQASAVLREMEERHALTLRDPLNLTDEASVRPCRLAGGGVPHLLTCEGHISAELLHISSAAFRQSPDASRSSSALPIAIGSASTGQQAGSLPPDAPHVEESLLIAGLGLLMCCCISAIAAGLMRRVSSSFDATRRRARSRRGHRRLPKLETIRADHTAAGCTLDHEEVTDEGTPHARIYKVDPSCVAVHRLSIFQS
ncbi:hypothetical protein AB1Y20_019736 [Prymnesium parvum]|uniref:Uncharacterized protein n=1 Tax=Prymnesium parvum TaxID=97485 RepID=A0AB34JRX9_PRYPA